MAASQHITKEFMYDKNFSTFEDFARKVEERTVKQQQAQLKKIPPPKKEVKSVLLMESSENEFQNWAKDLQRKVETQRKFQRERDSAISLNRLRSLEKFEQRRLQEKQLKKAKLDEIRSMAANFIKRRNKLPPLPYGSRQKYRLMQQRSKEGAKTAYGDLKGKKDEVFNLTQVQEKDHSVPVSAQDKRAYLDKKSRTLEGPQRWDKRVSVSEGKKRHSVISPYPQKSLQTKKQVTDSQQEILDFFSARIEDGDTKHKKDLIDLYDNLERQKIRDPQPGNVRVQGFGFKETPYYKILEQESKKGDKPRKKNFTQQIKIDIQFLRAKFRNYQKDLMSNTQARLSTENKQNFKKVLNKILDISEMSFDRHMENVKMRRKFRYPFLNQSEDYGKSPIREGQLPKAEQLNVTSG